jgi:pimeloyl-ACP methyl ester carboxylesterase
MIAGGCADKLILYPRTEPIRTPGAMRVALPWAGGEVEVWSRREPATEDPHIFVLAFGGNAERAEEVVWRTAEEWSGRPVEVWAVNYPGYGGSTGPAKLSSIAPAALLAYDALKQRAAGRPIFLDGMSIGTAAALFLAARRPCAGLLLTNPPPLRRLILGKFGWWNLWLLAGPVALGVPADLDSVANARKCRAPAVFVSADRDEVVPPTYHKVVMDAYAGPKQVIVLRGAGHNTPPVEEEGRRIRESVEGMVGR